MLASMLVVVAAQAVTLEKTVVRAAPAGEDAAAYVAIANSGAADRLVGAACDCAERVEIHRVVRAGGNVSMDSAAALPVPAGRTEIRPGSDLHLMLMNLRAPLASGQSVPVVLRFERAGAVSGSFVAVEDTGAAWQAAPGLATELAPLSFLVGSCWRATFPNSAQTDMHCYTAMLGGRYVRDLHVVEGAPAPYSGETIYRWDPSARRIRYDYYASDGGYSGGHADPTPAGLDFPEENYVGPGGQRLTLRNVLVRTGDGYAGTSSARQADGSWREMWTMRFTRVGPAAAPR
jgi:copper(I)-binding protein